MNRNNFKISCTILIALWVSVYTFGQSHIDVLNSNTKISIEELDSYMHDKFRGDTSRIASKNMKFFNRWKNNYLGRLDKEGKIKNYPSHNYKELKKLIKRDHSLVQHPNTNRNLHGSWELVSPTNSNQPVPTNGRVNCITFHPTNNNIIYIGTPYGGLWKTYNGGNSWINLNEGFDNLGVTGIAINPNNPDIVYMLTGGGNGYDCPSMGVFKSNDGGYTWEKTGLFIGESESIFALDFKMDATDPDKMYAATSKGIFITEDGWETSYQQFDSNVIRDVEYALANPQRVFAASNNKIFRSTNGGIYWAQLSDLIGLPANYNWHRVDLAVSESEPEWIYALFARKGGDELDNYFELYKSEDSGEMFSLVSTGYDVVSNQCQYNLELSVDPQNANIIYLGAINLFKSTDGGLNFTNITPSGTTNFHVDCHELIWNNTQLYIGHDGGISKSINGGSSFIDLSDGLSILQVYDMDVENEEILVGTQDNGTFQWTVGDQEMVSAFGSDGFECFFHPEESGIYVSTQTNRWRKLEEDDPVTKITPPNQENSWNSAFIMHVDRPDTLFSNKNMFSRSYDKGITWESFFPGFADTAKHIEIMVQSESDPKVIYLSNQKEIRKSINVELATPEWMEIDNDLPSTLGVYVGDITVDPTDKNNVWITLMGYEDGHKVYFSDTGGEGSNAWTNITGNLPNVPAFSIQYLPGSNGGLYVGTDLGVFYKDNDLTDWIWFSNGLPKTKINDIKYTSDYLYVGTYGRGVWRSPHFGNCPYALVLNPANDPNSDLSTGTQFHTADHIIVSNRIISGGFGTNVTYNAGNTIELTPGFHAKTYSEFKAKIDGCPN